MAKDRRDIDAVAIKSVGQARGPLLPKRQRAAAVQDASGIFDKQTVSFAAQFLEEVEQVSRRVDRDAVERAVDELARVRERGGRLFILGLGGSAANASHAVNDFRKICAFECYAPTDNVSELTARTNDEGWDTVFGEWLKGSRLNACDGLLVFSVGGGDLEKNVSANLIRAIQLAQEVGASVVGIVGRDGGFTAKTATACVIIPTVNPEHVTPHSEAFQAVIWHLFVSHPKLKVARTKWEGVAGQALKSDKALKIKKRV